MYFFKASYFTYYIISCDYNKSIEVGMAVILIPFYEETPETKVSD